ncbi:TetR family transcriptional regulator [Ammoniphilus sp. CFH 90114]|uniref:TetR family transcriptional regulator n=1 Tax=Ammoniphilus sp. CFH 90114 TaxID=2493665 RepID=UPI00100E495D|nr:TetR family transcriptional regulator [Ammoniphilus sp. CFH 90114]RXT14785.1 TetR/AcrR family transcriptional regulator [Ammoniphilus sp. CFH 90114]
MSEQHILEASRKLFAMYGYDYVSVRKIASEADVNIGSISYYFHNKIGILQKIVEDFYLGLGEMIHPILDGPITDRSGAIKALTGRALEYMYNHFDSSRVVLREITLETERFEEVIKPNYMALNNKLITFFERVGTEEPRRALIKFMALTRYPFSNANSVELYYQRPFGPDLFDEYIETVLSSLSSELSA